MACRHFHGTTGSPPPGTAHTPPRRPRWTVRPRSPSRTVADAHAAPPAAGQATASAALLSPQQPNPVVVPSTPRCSGCCDDQLNPPNTPRSPTAAACTPPASSLPWARSGMRWTTPSPRASSPPWNASCSTATLADQSRAAHGDLRFHRGLLQPPTPPLDTRLRQPRQLRAAARTSSTRRLTTVSTKAGQLHDVRYQAGRYGSGFKPRPKSDAGIREVPLAPLVVEAICGQLPPGADANVLVFAGPGGGNYVAAGTRTVLSRHGLRRMYQTAVKRADLGHLQLRG